MALLELVVKWCGKEYNIRCNPDVDTVKDLKLAVFKETGVCPERQKLLGCKLKGKAAADDVKIGDLLLRQGAKIIMVGSHEEEIQQVMKLPEDLPEVVNDFECEEIETENRVEFLAKVEKRIKDYEVKLLNQHRPGKKLLVLDIDYTIFDNCSEAQHAAELMRPYLHEFLTRAYEDYNIVIWSATNMKWIDVKLKQLGVSSNSNYKILFYLDSSAMISIVTQKYGLVDVKPLGVIWGKFEQYNAKNTIIIDDLRRNFLMNPKNGLKVKPYKNAHKNKFTDDELLKLSRYLKDIAKLEDISELSHRHWRSQYKDD